MIRRIGASRLPSRNTVLFLVAVALPCAVLAGLTIRMMAQQRELAENRQADARRALIASVRTELLSQLERIKFQALAHSGGVVTSPAIQGDLIAFVAPLDHARMLLPWERASATGDHAPAFWDAMRTGESAEYLPGRAAAAVEGYKAALSRAASPSQAAVARLALSRALVASGRTRDADVEARQLLRIPTSIRDEQGIPIAFYAARRQLSRGSAAFPYYPSIVELLERSVATDPPMSPVALYMIRDLSQDLAARAEAPSIQRTALGLAGVVARRAMDGEQALALRDSLAAVLPSVPSPPAGESPWALFGSDDNPWFVSSGGPDPVKPSMLVAVRLSVFRTQFEALPLLRDKGVHLVLREAVPDTEPMGSALRGVSLALPSPESAALAREEVLQRRFTVVALLLVVGIAWSGGYFYWLHVQRDLRLAEMRSQFVSSVSHELKTPLTSIRMFAETLLMGRTARPETRDEYLETILNESERLTRLINNVLDFSKIEQGTKTYRRQPQSLGDIIRAAARVMEYPLVQEGFELHVEVDTEVPLMPVDRDAIQQAILNLLNNAMKYSAEARVIDLTLARSSGEIRIDVVDRGTGIAHAEHSKIFQKFYRSATLENKHIPGTGLGLTIVEHVAAAHGGRVDVTSGPGKGSTFSIVLPLPPAEAIEHRTGGVLDPAHAPHSGH